MRTFIFPKNQQNKLSFLLNAKNTGKPVVEITVMEVYAGP
jgi:hypothetical protein